MSLRLLLAVLVVGGLLSSSCASSRPVSTGRAEPTTAPAETSVTLATRSPGRTASPGPTGTIVSTSQSGTRPAATPRPTFTPIAAVTPATVATRTFNPSTPVVAGERHPQVGGDCLTIAARSGVVIQALPGAAIPLRSVDYARVAPAAITPAAADVNLRPFDGGGLVALAVYARPGTLANDALNVGQAAYIDWSIRNDGPGAAPSGYDVDLYFDGVLVNRWQGIALQSGGTAGIRDWDQLDSFVRITPGSHTVRLVIDATRAVQESNETDNVIERNVTWSGEEPARLAAGRLPDLWIAPVEGAAQPLVVSNHPEALASGGLSSEYRTYLSWAIENRGLASTPSKVLVHLFFDDVFVTTRIADGVTAGGLSSVLALDALEELGVHVEPGSHRLRLVVDPGDLVAEADESNNSYENEFTWRTGQPQPVAVQARATLTADRTGPTTPNLRPEVPRGWDGPLVFRGAGEGGEAAEGRETAIVAGMPFRVDFAVTNASPIATSASFEVAVVLDGREVDQARFRGGPDDSGAFWTGSIDVPGELVAAGRHTVSLTIDTGRVVAESDEADNRCERVMDAGRTTPAIAAPISYTAEQVHELARPLVSLLQESEPLGGRTEKNATVHQAIMGIAEAAYFSLVGRSLIDERISVHVLARDEYDRLTLAACMAHGDSLQEAEFAERLNRCTSERDGESGLETRWLGRVHVFVDADQTPAAVLATLFHELGHAREALLAQDSGNGVNASPTVRALHEAQAQIFEAAMWRGLQDGAGLEVPRYPDITVMRTHLRQRLDRRVDGANEREEHDLGYVLLWLHALKDPDRLGLASQLGSAGQLDASSALRLYDALRAIPDSSAASWANSLTEDASPLIDEFFRIALGRLVPGLPPDLEGHPDLKDAALIAP